MSWMQSHDRRSRAKAPVERGRCCYAGSSEETIRVGLAEKGTATTPWLMDRMRQLLLPVKLSARKKKLSVQERYHWMVLLLWVLSWSLFSLWIFSSMSSGAIEMRREELASMCDERARMLEDQVKVSMNQLQALSILVSTFHHSKHPSAIDQTTFARYVERTAFERPLTSGLAYAVRVMHDKRELFEQQQEWSIKMMCSSKGMNISHALPAEEYAPVIFAQDAYKHVVSFDMLSGTEDRDNVLRARESGKAVLTAPFKLLNNRIGVILTYAVYKSELPPNATVQYRIRSAIGYLGAIFDIEAHVDKLLQKLAGKESIAVNVYDTTNKKPISMYGSNDTGSDWYNVCILNFGDPSRKHEMRCKFVQKPSWPWLAITSSFGTLVVSLLVDYIFHFTGKQTAKVKGTDVIQAIHGHEEVKELEPDKVVDQEEVELNLRLEVEDKLNETQRNLEELGERSKFITMVKKLDYGNTHSLPAFRCLNKKIMIIILVGLVLYILIIGPFEQPFNLRLGMRRCMMLHNHKYGFARGRLLISTLHGPWAKPGVQVSDMIRVDLRKVTGNNDSSGHQKHWSSHNSSEIPAVLFVPWNGKEVKVRCNLIADEKALANWISNSNTVQSSKYRNKEAITEIQNGTVNPHLSAHISHKTMVGPLIALAAVIMLVLGTAVWFLLWCTHRRRVQQNELEIFGGMGPRPFERDELAAATSNFTDENKLGQGGFGPVYKGYLRDQDLHVAIKVLCRKQSSEEQSEQGLREFKAEVKVMTQLRHRNIVKLVGWCDSKNQLLLVYELMAQGSLDKHLYDPEKTLTWPQRFKIVLDLGSGLLYLHHDCEKCIVHGDIKPANVMLDVSHNAKLGDFGLARLIEHGGEPQTTQVVAGTPGYIDPEFINNRWPRTELDVYSFGVVLLEITCGKRPASRQPSGASSLLAWVHDLYDRGMVLNAADPRLNGEFDQRQMERVIVTGLWCAHQDPIQRPSIMQAMDVLRCADAELPVLPAAHDARRIRFMEEQAYADLPPVEDPSAGAVTQSRYFTSKDSVYLLAEE